MYRDLLIVTALLIAIYCLMLFIRQIVICKKVAHEECAPVVSLLLLIKDQQEVIEGLIRQALSESAFTVEVIAVDVGSKDQTKMIMERLSGQCQSLIYLVSGNQYGIVKRVHNLCHGETIYCFDLTGQVNYELMSRTINSILSGSKASLYRTKVYKTETKD